MDDNVSGFVTELVRCKIIPIKLPFNSFVDVFSYLNSLNKPLNIIEDINLSDNLNQPFPQAASKLIAIFLLSVSTQ